MPPPSGDGMGMGSRKPLGEIARELGAGLLLEGSVARENDRIVLTASLVQAAPLKNLWRRTFSRPAGELQALQRDLAEAVLAELAGPRGAARLSPRQYDPEAHEAYLKGAYYQSHWKLPQAVESFTRAVEIDPAHAAAHAGLARAYYFLAFFGDLSPVVALAGMRRAATTALEHDPLMADAHAQLALVKMLQDWDWDGAEQSFRQALELSPENAQIRHDFAHFLLGQGRRRESMEQARQAVELDPVNPMLISCLGWHSLFDARFEDAARLATEATALMPDQWAEVVHGWALLGRGDAAAAVERMRAAVRLKENPFTVAALAHALATAGFADESRRTLESLVQRSDHEYVSAYDISTVYAGLGDADGAFKWLRRAADERSMFIVHVGWDLRLEPLRADQRLADLVAREMRLPAPKFASVTAHERRGI
jgi:adenylate cyclase